MRLSVGLIHSEVSWNQPEELTEQVDLNQQVQLTTKDMRSRMMIGGIQIFLPCAQEEAKIGIANDATEEQSQLTMTVKRKLEQTFETAQADERKNERSEEQLNDFSQRAESVVALELTVEEEAEAEEESEHSEEWLNAFSDEAEETATWEVAEAEEEGVDNICFAELWQQIESLEERVMMQEHLSTSASQPASHVRAHAFKC
jgi:hypothetical protein